MPLQSMIAKTMLKLPPSWLYRMAGGAPVQIAGRTMDPHIQLLSHGAKTQTPIHEMEVVAGRAASAAGLAMFAAKPEPGVTVEDIVIPAEGRDVLARVYRPKTQDPDAALMVYGHMGGGVIGDVEYCHVFCSMIAAIAKRPVVSIDYRLAPEHKWPAGLNDFIDAYLWALGQAEAYGAPAGRAAVGGDSMGGNFAAILSQEMKRRGAPAPEFQLLVYPAVDMESDTASMTEFGECYPLSTATMEWFMTHYMPEGADLGDVRFSPMNETDLSDLPPALIVTAGFDPLVDQAAEYADRLKAAGVKAVYRCFDGLAHGFTAFTAVSPAADSACREIAELVRDFK
ncbi:MAG: alpha/beta hydrolase [Pseudomonadota bacterium]